MVTNRLRPSAKPQTIKTPDMLKLKVEPLANCRQYNQLLIGTSNVIH
jgi:hypothetical protein